MAIFGIFILITLPLIVSTVKSANPVAFNEKGNSALNPGDVTSEHSKLLHSSLEVSKSCNDDFQLYLYYLDGIIQSSPVKAPLWVYQLLDATGKPGTGFLEGAIQWVGSFTECLKIEVAKYNSTEIQFRGKYCTGNLAIPSFTPGQQIEVANHLQPMLRPILNGVLRQQQLLGGPTLALCMPSSCTAPELNQLINDTLTMFKITEVGITLSEDTCYTKEATKYSAGSIIFIIVLAAVAVLLILGTLYEVALIRRKSKDGSSQADKSTFERVLISFSVYKNGQKIIDTSHGEGTLTCLHGIRFFSMAWVVLCHTYGSAASMAFKNWFDLPSIIRAIAFDIITNGFFSVDTFFFLSGFLVAYLFIKEMKKTAGRLGPYKIFLFYFHRYWRLTPALAIGIAFIAEIYKYLENGPAWKYVENRTVDSCRDYWWRNLLYIQNFFNVEQMCFGVSWYLACDMQFYAVSLFIIYPLYRFKTVGLTILGVIFTASVLTPGLIIHFMDLSSITSLNRLPDENKEWDFQNYVYMKPWCRMGPYLVGIMLAVILHKTTLKPKLPPMYVAIGWLLATVLGLALVFGTHDYITGDKVMSDALNSIYGACNRPAWAMVVAWVVFACVTGHGGFVNTILSWKALVPLSRLTYSTYLIHMYLLLTFFGSQESVYYFSHYLIILLFLGMLVISLALAFVFSLAFEAPLIELEKIFLPRRTNDSPPRLLDSQQGTSHVQISTVEELMVPEPLERSSRKKAYENGGFQAEHDYSSK